jgi:NADH-quinone oxidoreductase subunit J
MAGFAAEYAFSPAAALLAATASGNAATPAPASLLSPTLVLVLCVIAGLGTVLLLPSRRPATFRKVGGAALIAAGLILVAALIHRAAGIGRGHMSVYFWLFSAVAVVGAVRVITHPRPVYSALYFVLSVIATAGLFILLWAEFMAAALVIIYAGAILVTYVFVIMLATQTTTVASVDDPAQANALAEYDVVSREPIVASAVGFTLMGVLLYVILDRASQAPPAAAVPGAAAVHAPGSVQAIGTYLFKSQLVNLELAGLILTIAMVGAILIARRQVTVSTPAHASGEVLVGPATPVDDNPHSIPVYGTDNPRHKAYPET